MKPYALRLIGMGIGVDDPVWSDVETRIERAFNGGHVTLQAGVLTLQRTYVLLLKEAISMEAEPGMFRIIVSPEREPGQKKNLREWWEPEDSPFRGTERFRDDESGFQNRLHRYFRSQRDVQGFFR